MIPHTSTDILILFISYVLGSLPSGLFMSRLFTLQDPRTLGSQGTGATNVLRTGHKKAAAFTLVLDVAKGALAVMLARIFDPSLAPLAGLIAIVGHIWPLWLGFQGGKGVATALGVMGGLSWPVAVACLVTWLSVSFVTRYSSLASLTALLLSPLYAIFLDISNLIPLCILIGGLILWTHRANIDRLRKGRETQIGDFAPPSED